MKSFKHYLNHLKVIVVMSYNSVSVYRADFILRLVRSVFEILITVVFLRAVYQQDVVIGNWSQLEANLVAAIALLTVSLVMFLFGNGLEGLHRDINEGTLDRLLLQPLDVQWLTSTRIIFVTNIFRMIFNTLFLYLVFQKINQPLNFGQFILFIICFISGCVIYYSLMFSAAVISFWALSGELFYLFNNFTSIAKYPIDIFGSIAKMSFTFIPVIFIATVPAQALLGKPSFLIYLSPLIAAFSFYLTRQFWLKGLRAYDSASS